MHAPDRKPFARFIDPLDRAYGWFLPHLLLVLIVLGIILAFALGFVSGWQARPVYDAHFFQHRYNVAREHIPVPKAGKPVPVRPRALPATATINQARYPAVGDQGTLGACAAWATAWQVSYEWRLTHPNSYLRFSPRQLYDHYSDVYNGGQDGGSWPDRNIEISNTTGLLQFKMLPEPPYVIDDPIPTYDAYGHLTSTDAAKHRFPTSVHALGPITTGGGQGVVDNIEATIAANHAALIALPVYPEFDNATQTNGLIGMPQPGEGSRGGHEIVAIAYDETKVFPDGWRGGIEVQNQWATWWGVGGRAWLETRFVAQYVFGAEWISIGLPAGPVASHPSVGSGVPADGGRPIQPVTGAKPPKNEPKTAPKVGASGWYIKPFYTIDTHENIAPQINSVATRNHIWPVYALAVVMAESGGATGASSERFAVWPDWSCGLMQQIISNVTSYTGITNTRQACNWEEVPANSIGYGTLLLHQYMQQTGVGYPGLWQCYNAGPGSCQSPYYQAFLTHYWIALGYATNSPGPTPTPPPPPPTPKKSKFGKLPARVWGQYRKEHHLSFIPHKGWFALHWKHGDYRHAGGIVQQEQWNPKRHTMTEFLQGGWSFWWPGHPRYGTKWKGHPWLR